jgi:hypothetical protein
VNHQYVLENKFLSRTLSTQDGILRTVQIVNHRAGATDVPSAAPEFVIRISQGTNLPATVRSLSATDFSVVKSEPFETAKGRGLAFTLENSANEIRLEVHYELNADDFYLHKQLTITSAKPVTLERIDIEAISIKDAVQPYKIRAINARGKWSPGLGQPLWGSESATFWGVEFPAADNHVDGNALRAGYLWGRELRPGQPYVTYSAVLGVADDPKFIQEAFFEYIDRIRIRPLRMEVQYNTWFDTGHGVNKENFRESVQTIHHELVEKRGNHPLSAYVIDDGWQDTGADWSDKMWKVNKKFDPDFASSLAAVKAAQSHLGLWLSPGCLFGAGSEVPKLRKGGYEALDTWMSIAGPKYMQKLEDRMTELTRLGVSFFKLDGIFGHLNERNFELHGERYGLPDMSQLGLEKLHSGDAELNDPKYDELKIYYLTAGTERLMQLFDNLAKVNPDIYLVISNGAYLSPWWLMHVDTVWMINAGDAASGSTRTKELVYRDGVYYEIWRTENTQFPMCSIFNHEPKKTSTGESKDAFRKYLFMHLSRGTGFLELYIRPKVLSQDDWDVLSEGVSWARKVFPAFKRVHMHGGNPRNGEVYGYSAWTKTFGYISIHNPGTEPRSYSVKLDREAGLVPGSGPFVVSSPIEGSTTGLAASYQLGDALQVNLQPGEIRILNFVTHPPK